MSSLDSIYGSLIWYSLCIVSMFLLLGSLHISIRSFSGKWSGGKTLPVYFNVILSFVIFFILMDCAMYPVRDDYPADFLPIQLFVYSMPWFFIAGMELMSVGILLLTEAEGRHYRSTHLTMDAIRRSVDHLPEGIAVGSADGTVLLTNLRMDSLYRDLTGGVLSDTKSFLDRIGKRAYETEPQLIVSDTAGRLWLFEKDAVSIDDKEYLQIIARDVTQQYGIIEELKEKNERLKDIQIRMKAVAELSGDMFVAEEQAKARAELHNQLGQVLLMGRYYLKNQKVADPRHVYAITGQMNRFLLGEAEEKGKTFSDVLTEAVTMAGGIGVSVHMNDDIPEGEHLRELLSAAIVECAANTVKHAAGDRIEVSCHTETLSGDPETPSCPPEHREGFSTISIIKFTITNNGNPPKGAIAESGGLLSLRRKVEAAGGSMQTESEPAFRLTILVKSG